MPTAHVLVALMAAHVGLDPDQLSSSSKERSTRFWPFRLSRRICVRGM
jgi:hypothetical protein